MQKSNSQIGPLHIIGVISYLHVSFAAEAAPSRAAIHPEDRECARMPGRSWPPAACLPARNGPSVHADPGQSRTPWLSATYPTLSRGRTRSARSQLRARARASLRSDVDVPFLCCMPDLRARPDLKPRPITPDPTFNAIPSLTIPRPTTPAPLPCLSCAAERAHEYPSTWPRMGR